MGGQKNAHRKVQLESRPYSYHEEPLVIFADDEPLEKILYSEGSHVQTPLNHYLSTYTHARSAAEAFEDEDMEGAIAALSGLTIGDPQLSVEMCRFLAEVLTKIFPKVPYPRIDYDYASFGNLLKRMWGLSLSQGGKRLQVITAPLLTRWYECFEQYEESRQVHRHILELHRKDEHLRHLASALNNLGFVYTMEQRWAEALPYFREAIQLYLVIGMEFNEANSSCNWWQCRIEMGEWGEYEQTKIKLEGILEKLKGELRWYERKPHILLARLEERQGNLYEAIRHVKLAIESALDSGTRYPEMDGMYLRKLQSLI